MSKINNTFDKNAVASGAFDPRNTREKLKERLKNFRNVDSDDKAIPWDELSSRVYRLKNRGIKIGLKVLEMLIDVIESIPYTISLSLVAGIINIMISSIPLIGFGWMLGPLTGALLMTSTLVVGLALDLKLNVVKFLRNDIEATRKARQN